MEYIRNRLDFSIEQPTVIMLGKFDGLHRGHELLMDALLAKSRENGWSSVVFTFDIPPASRINAEKLKVLTTKEEKLHIFERTGADYLIECPFTDRVRNLSPESFIDWIVDRLHVKCIVMGKDFRFGYQRAGDYHTMQAYASRYGYETLVLEKVQENGRDISSTDIREALLAGKIADANRMLGYEFFVRGKVIHGKQLGRTLGIPTINMELPEEKILPPKGVYVTRVEVDGTRYMGVSNIGCKPTIPGSNPMGLETYILDFSRNLYDCIVQVDFLQYLRPEMKFSSVEELQRQMKKDIQKAKEYVLA